MITAAATYPQPNRRWPGHSAWANSRQMSSGIRKQSRKVDIVPDKQKCWPQPKSPLAVIVGLDDTGELPLELISGQKGKNRFTIAQNWITDMAAFAEENGAREPFQHRHHTWYRSQHGRPFALQSESFGFSPGCYAVALFPAGPGILVAPAPFFALAHPTLLCYTWTTRESITPAVEQPAVAE